MVKHLGATDIAFLLESLFSSPDQRESGMTITKSSGAGARPRSGRKSPVRAVTMGGGERAVGTRAVSDAAAAGRSGRVRP